MSLFRRETRAASDSLITQALYQRMRGSASNSSGVFVDEDSAQRHSAVWGCRSAISEALQQLPVEEQRLVDGRYITGEPPSIFFDPAPGWTWEQWIWAQSWALSGHGKAYAWITVGSRGAPVSMEPVDPSKVKWTFDNGEWKIKVGTESVKLWPRGPLWHCPLYVTPSCPEGLSPIAYHAQSIGVGLAAQRFGAQFFGDGAHPTAVAKILGDDPGGAAAKSLKERLVSVMSGNREPLVLSSDISLEKWQVAPEESQFLDTMRYSGEDVARIFGTPPEMIGLSVSGSNLVYSNAGDRNANWRVNGLSRYVVPFESALSRLVPAGNRRTIRFNFSGFLRADPKTRAEFYKTAAEIGDITGTPLLHVNEMRSEERLEPLDGGDVFVRRRQQTQTEPRAAVPPVDARDEQHTHIHLPDSLQVDMKPPDVTVNVDVPQVDVHVDAPRVDVAAPVVNVEPPAVYVDAPAPVVVPAPVVNVNSAPPQLSERRATGYRVVRDRQGRVSGIEEDDSDA